MMQWTTCTVWHSWIELAQERLTFFESDLNAINVFPVADADTGTNMLRTLAGAVHPDPQVGINNSLNVSRGNSGTLLALWLKEFVQVMGQHEPWKPATFERALKISAQTVEQSLSKPESGTMLTVMEALGEVASKDSLTDYVGELIKVAQTNTEQTQQTLAQAREAHTVDAGAAGFLLVIVSLGQVLGSQYPRRQSIKQLLTPGKESRKNFTKSQRFDKGEVEVVCTVQLPIVEITELRSELDVMGDSLVIAPLKTESTQGTPVWRIHLHVGDAQKVIRLIENYGEPHNLEIIKLTGEKG